MKSLSASSILAILLFFLSLVNGVSSQCISNLTDIYISELTLNDLSKNRTYILCPDTVFAPSDFTGEIIPNGDVPIFLRSNAIVKCGTDGSSSNSCVIDGAGTTAIFISPFWYGLNETEVENVVVQGITVNFYNPGTLDNPIIPIIVGLSSGDVTFLDCVFSNNLGDPLFILDQYVFTSRNLEAVPQGDMIDGDLSDNEEGTRGLSHPESRRLQVGTVITFDSCTFDSNIGPDVPTTNGGISLLSFGAYDPLAIETSNVVGTLDVNLINNTFIDNDYSVDGDTSIYRSLIDFFSSGVLKMKNNCFINSPVTQSNASSIVDVQTDSTLISINNYVDPVQTELLCPYVIEFNADYSMAQCRKAVFNASKCARDTSGTPTGTTTVPVTTPAPAAISPSPAVPTSSQQPVLTTAAPTSSQQPVLTTAAPTSSQQPVLTTDAPTTQAPAVPTSSSQPVLTTTAPVNATQSPVSTSPTSKAPTSAGEVTKMCVWTVVMVLVVQGLSYH